MYIDNGTIECYNLTVGLAILYNFLYKKRRTAMFTIDFTSRVPIYEQICNNIIKLASAGVFKSGDRLPPV